jgi:hypothetical protein
MNVEIGNEAAQCPEKEYINGIFVAVQRGLRVIALLQGPTINSATQNGMTRPKLSMEWKMCPPCGPDIFNIKFLFSKVISGSEKHINKPGSSDTVYSDLDSVSNVKKTLGRDSKLQSS